MFDESYGKASDFPAPLQDFRGSGWKDPAGTGEPNHNTSAQAAAWKAPAQNGPEREG